MIFLFRMNTNTFVQIFNKTNYEENHIICLIKYAIFIPIL